MKLSRKTFLSGGRAALTAALLLALASSAFAGHGEGCHRESGSGSMGRHDIAGVRQYDQTDGSVSTDGVNAGFGPCYSQAAQAALDDDAAFTGGFCVSSDLNPGHETLEVYCRGVRHDQIWLRDRDDGHYYPVSADDTISIADNGWADLNLQAGAVETEVLFSRATGEGAPPADGGSGSGGGGCSAGTLSFAPLLLCAPLFLPRRWRTKPSRAPRGAQPGDRMLIS